MAKIKIISNQRLNPDLHIISCLQVSSNRNNRRTLYPISHIQIMKNKKAMQLDIVSVVFLMLSTGAVYLVVATEEIAEASGAYEEQNPNESIEGALIETVFFATVGEHTFQ